MKRFLSALLALCVLVSLFPAAVLSEEEIWTPAEQEDPAEVQDEAPAQIDFTRDASYSPAFIKGYASLLTGVTINTVAVPAGAVVYVYDRTLEGTLCVVADMVAGTLPAEVAVTAVRPMSDEEVAACMADLSMVRHWFDEGRTLPLFPFDSEEAPAVSVPVPTEEPAASAQTEEVLENPTQEPEPSAATAAPAEESAATQAPEEEQPEATNEPMPVLPAPTVEEPVEATVPPTETPAAVPEESTAPPAEPAVDASAYTAPKDVVSSGTIRVAVGKTVQGSTKLGTNWACADTEIATITSDAVLTGVKPGTTTITVTDSNGKEYLWDVEVYPVAAEMTLDQTRVKLGVKETATLHPVFPEDGITEKVTWKSSSTKVATVSATGVVTAVKTGDVTITATSENGLKATCKVSVYKAVSKITISPSTLTVGVGETRRFTASFPSGTYTSSLTWSVADAGMAQIDEATGELTGLSVGMTGATTVTVKAGNGVKATAKLIVRAAPDSVAIDLEAPKQLVMGEKQMLRLSATLSDKSASTLSWESAETAVATVSDRGEVTAVGVGETDVTVRTFNGCTDSVHVVVKPAPGSVALNCGTVTLGIGETFTMQAVLPEGTAAGITWASSQSKYAAVNQDGVVRGVRVGSARVGFKTHNGKSATVTVKVLKHATKATISPSTLVLGEKQTGKVKATFGSKTVCSRAQWRVEDEALAQIDPDTGEVTALKAGSTRIGIFDENGKRLGVSNLTVKPEPTSVAFAENPGPIGVGQVVSPKASVNKESVGPVGFVSQNPEIARIDEKGRLVGVAVGTARIEAVAYNGVSTFADVEVRPAPTFIRFVESSVKVGLGETLRLVTDMGEGAAALTWSTASSRIATVSADGTVKGVRTGKVKITVKTSNGLSAVCEVTVCKAPGSIEAAPKKQTLGVGETAKLTYTLPSGTYTSKITWKSSDDGIVAVNPDGSVTAKGTGTATMTVTTGNGKKDTCTVVVAAAPESIAYAESEVTLSEGMVFSTPVTLSAGSAGHVTFTTDDASVCEVNQQAQIRGAVGGAGQSTVVRATTYNGKTAELKVNVLPAPTSVSVTGSVLTIGIGQSVKAAATVDQGVSTYKWSSSSTKVATVSADGTIKGVKAGTAEVKVTTYNGKTATVKVTVKKAPTGITLNTNTIETVVNGTYALKATLSSGSAGSVTYSVDKKDIAEVDEKGNVTAKAAGEATITATTYNGKKATCKVLVYQAPTSAVFNTQEEDLGVGEKLKLSVTFNEGAFSPLKWSTSDKSVATVSGGVVTGVAYGTATITAQTMAEGVFAAMTVHVWNAPASVSLPESAIRLEVDKTYTLSPEIPADSRTTYIYASNNIEVATVSDEGVVKGISTGTAKIGVKTHNGKIAYVTVTVFDPYRPESLTVDNIGVNGLLVAPGASKTIKTTVLPSTAIPALVWKSSKPEIATVSDSGVIKGVKNGVSTITVYSTRNKDCKASFAVYVYDVDDVTTEVPEWTTTNSSSAISVNVQKMRAVYDSAMDQIDMLYYTGQISSSDRDKRRSIVQNAFTDLNFPWVTTEKQLYWKAANSENGAKDFQTNRVYYGLPYTSNSDTRRYNKAKVLSEKRFISYDGKYKLNRNALLNGDRKYAGNDCSAFASQAIWGTKSSYSYYTTSKISSASVYRTVSWDALRPGDLINKGSAHVVIFLYWLNEDHTKMMIIENGGSPAGTNTVHCWKYNTSYYTENGYKPKRLSSLG